MIRSTRWVAAAVAAIVAVGCAPGEPPKRSRPLVVVTVPPQAFYVRTLAGDAVDVGVLIPPGAGPHTYEPTLRDLEALQTASLWLKIGHPTFTFERTWLDRLSAERPDLVVADASAGIAVEAGDGHYWLGPDQARSMARNTAAALAALVPQEQAAIASRLAALEAEFAALQAELAALFAGHRGQSFWVFHPAWGYLARDYGLVQQAIEQDGKHPDARLLGQLVNDARAAGVRVLFAQPQFDRLSAQAVAEAVGAEVRMLDPLADDGVASLRRAGQAIAQGLVP